MIRFVNLISRTLCFHRGSQLIRTTRNRVFLECMDCGRTTQGVEVEGF